MINNGLFTIVTWDYFKKRLLEEFNISFVKVDDFFQKKLKWISLDGYEDFNDVQILECLESLREFSGILFVVTDASYKKNFGPFQAESINIKNFVEYHFEQFGERFLETDVLIISFELKVIWIFHHEGVYSLIEI